MTVSTPMMVTFCVYILGMVLIGFIAYRSTKNFDDYILGGRSLGVARGALARLEGCGCRAQRLGRGFEPVARVERRPQSLARLARRGQLAFEASEPGRFVA